MGCPPPLFFERILAMLEDTSEQFASKQIAANIATVRWLPRSAKSQSGNKIENLRVV
ncbi:hypothetical protein SCG7086_AL_00040 [Chlamydiales bacterium SCGC AG-110-P3]|nr:hypothetical protein SCG7086_AL_00040 [Chlamydiales bacterium SCGC AG-110-P3]